jgi:hypothetical protein
VDEEKIRSDTIDVIGIEGKGKRRKVMREGKA